MQVTDLESLYNDQQEAVAREDYRAAAALKAQREELEAANCVGAALKELDAAVAQERFAGGCCAAGNSAGKARCSKGGAAVWGGVLAVAGVARGVQGCWQVLAAARGCVQLLGTQFIGGAMGKGDDP